MKRKLALLMAVATLSVTAFTGCTIGDTEYVWNVKPVISKEYVFTINGIECSKEEAKLYLCNYQNIYGHEYGVNLWEHDFGYVLSDDSLENYVKDITLTELANIMCMTQLAKAQDVSLTEEELTKVENATNEYFSSLTEAELAYMELDKNELKEFYKKYATAQKLFDTLTEGVNEEVSDDEARVIRVQQIYVETKEDADIVLAKLENKDDFASVASNHNEASTIETTMKRDEYPIEVEAVAFQLDNGEQTGMITTEKGYYFIKCISKYEEELTEQNKVSIIAKRRKEQFEDVFQGFVETSEFVLNESIWEGIIIDTSGTITTNSFFEVYDNNFAK